MQNNHEAFLFSSACLVFINRQKTEQARVLAEAEGRIRQERENQKIHLDKAILEAKEYRQVSIVCMHYL